MVSKILQLLRSKQMPFFLVIGIVIYCSYLFFVQHKVRGVCEKKYSKCVIVEIQKTLLGAVFIKYGYWITGHMRYHTIKRYKTDSVIQNLHIGDTLLLEYCKENPLIYNDPIVNGEYLNPSLR